MTNIFCCKHYMHLLKTQQVSSGCCQRISRRLRARPGFGLASFSVNLKSRAGLSLTGFSGQDGGGRILYAFISGDLFVNLDKTNVAIHMKKDTYNTAG